MDIFIEASKSYIARNGRVIGPMSKTNWCGRSPDLWVEDHGYMEFWNDDGSFFISPNESPLDLVEEYKG